MRQKINISLVDWLELKKGETETKMFKYYFPFHFLGPI